MKKLIILLALSLIVGFTKPSQLQNSSNGFWKIKQTEMKWGVPVAVQMAIMNPEFRNANAPFFAFSQMLDKTWVTYQQNRNEKNRKDEFAKAINFLG